MESSTALVPTTVIAQEIGHVVSLTVYNQGMALVRERRVLHLQHGLNRVDFTDVTARLDTRSVSFVSLTDPHGTTILEQSCLYDGMSKEALLRRYIDESIEVTTEDGACFVGQLLSVQGVARTGAMEGGYDITLRQNDGAIVVVRLSHVRDIRFPPLSTSPVTRPTLRWLVQSARGGAHDVAVTYVTEGIIWTADYNLVLSSTGQSADVNGWITIANTSGLDFHNVHLKLAYSAVRHSLTPDESSPGSRRFPFPTRPAEPAPPETLPEAPRGLPESRYYSINRPLTVENGETKQVEFFSAMRIPASTYYVYDASPRVEHPPKYPLKRQAEGVSSANEVYRWLEFSRDKKYGLPGDLPPGQMRVYQEDAVSLADVSLSVGGALGTLPFAEQAALLVGEGNFAPAAGEREIRILLGKAVDLTGQRTQKSFRQISHILTEETFEIRLRSQRESETIRVRVPERLFRWHDWEILSASHDFVQVGDAAVEFRVDVPPRREIIITYVVRYMWPS